MKKRLISLIVAVVMLFSMLCPAAYADDETVSFDTCTHEWETPLRSGYSITIPGSDVSFSVKTEQCKRCKWYKHVATIFIAEFTYYSPLNVDANGLVPTELAAYWANVWYNNFGKNATATKFAAGGGSTSGGGVGRRPAGYVDDNGTANVSCSGVSHFSCVPAYLEVNHELGGRSSNFSSIGYKNYETYPNNYLFLSTSGTTHGEQLHDFFHTAVVSFLGVWKFEVPYDGLYYINLLDDTQNLGHFEAIPSSYHANEVSTDLLILHNDTYQYAYKTYAKKGDTVYFFYVIKYAYTYETNINYIRYNLNNLIVSFEPNTSSVVNQNTLTINNNTWNGNIYIDNSTNLTYIYPQYTTVNEKNETVTNISNTPIIYNNETKQYYTYDQTTKNYYYITYNAQPTPSPSPSPAPTEKPGGSISTPETGKPGGDTGDTTGIFAVLVEIRDNMIQGFLDIKAAFVAGFADFSANFTLAIENLTLNIQNFFFKGMSGSPVDPNIPGGGSISTPETGGSDSSGGSGWSWNPLKWLTDLLKDIVEGIIKTIWKLITSLFGFLLWLLSLVGKLFPFIPGQAVLAVTSAVVIVAVIRIIKFITGR